MLQAWIGTPLLLTTLCLGLGLLVPRMTPGLPPPAVVPAGLAMMIVLTGATTAVPGLAPATTTITVAASLAGFLSAGLPSRLRLWSSQRRQPGSRSSWRAVPLTLAAAGVYLVYAAPAMVATGPTFAGWIKLDDGATWLAMTDRLLQAGRNTTGLPASTYETTLSLNFATSYPTGAFPPLGVAAAMLGTDPAFVLQPYMAWLAAMLALCLGALLASARIPAGWRAWTAFLASQPALLLGYSLWGGVKEMVLAVLLVLVSLLSIISAGSPGRPPSRWSVLPLGLAAASVLLVAGISGAVWLVIPTCWLVTLRVRNFGWRSAAIALGQLLAVSVMAAAANLVHITLDEIAALAGYAAPDPSAAADIGNLRGRLSLLQVVGIWPVGDFRDHPSLWPTALLLLIVVAAAAYGVTWAVRRQRWELPLYVCATVPVALAAGLGGAWVGGKALAIASPALLCAAGLGLALLARGERTGAALAMAAVTTGVLWGSALAYRQAWLAPADELAELAAIGADQGLRGPALILDYSPYGARHFLRRLDAQGAGELRRDVIPMVSGQGLAKGEYANVDQFPPATLAQFRTLVVRRSVLASRPPADWTLARSGSEYEVWVRQDEVELPPPGRSTPARFKVGKHLPLGSWSPVAPADCADLRALAADAPTGSLLAYVPRAEVLAAVPLPPIPQGWTIDPVAGIIATGPGTLNLGLEVPRSGKYVGFLVGSFRGSMAISVDGQVILNQRHRITWPGHGTMTEPVTLAEGHHDIQLGYTGPDWHPGSAGQPFTFGPLLFSTSTADSAVRTAEPSRVDQLCTASLDWAELLTPA